MVGYEPTLRLCDPFNSQPFAFRLPPLSPFSATLIPEPGFLHILQALMTEVGVVEFGVMATGLHQGGVIPFFDDAALAHDDDAVC